MSTSMPVSIPALRAQLTFGNLKTIVFAYVLATQCLKSYRHLRARGLIATCLEIWDMLSRRVLTLALKLPAAQRKVETEMAKAKQDIEGKLVASGPNVVRHLSLPVQGRTKEWIDAEMAKMDAESGGGDKWKLGKLSGAVYHGGDDMEAGKYFGIKIHHIPVDARTRQVDIRHVRRAINANTIMLVGSAVNFPDGCMDDIEALSALAKKYRLGLHVDCCLGSFIVPFLEKLGYDAPRFDFRLEGVTAISCDTHKYGFAPKGSSVIMYRSADLRRYQYYLNPTWSGGVYASPSMSGSRPGSLIAGAWAAMQYMGQRQVVLPKNLKHIYYILSQPSSGYEASCRDIVECRKKIEKAIREDIPELRVLGKPVASVVAFASAESSLGAAINVLEVGDSMSRRGWHLNAL
ncbi:hypothetical protein FRC06_007111, partial [Ceratobasidium sp. 370]